MYKYTIQGASPAAPAQYSHGKYRSHRPSVPEGSIGGSGCRRPSGLMGLRRLR
jgi:hypothetical protein